MYYISLKKNRKKEEMETEQNRPINLLYHYKILLMLQVHQFTLNFIININYKMSTL